MERKNVLDIGKNNFSTFLYAAFCLDDDSPVFKSCCRILKKVGIDYSEVSALCPLLTKTIRCNNGVKVCARAYSGNNLIIAMGNYNQLYPHNQVKLDFLLNYLPYNPSLKIK